MEKCCFGTRARKAIGRIETHPEVTQRAGVFAGVSAIDLVVAAEMENRCCR